MVRIKEYFIIFHTSYSISRNTTNACEIEAATQNQYRIRGIIMRLSVMNYFHWFSICTWCTSSTLYVKKHAVL
jgi:hypothetical protein